MEYTFGFLRTVSVACHHGIQGDKHTSFCEALDRIDLKLCHSIMPLLPTAFQMFGSCLRKELSGWGRHASESGKPPPPPQPLLEATALQEARGGATSHLGLPEATKSPQVRSESQGHHADKPHSAKATYVPRHEKREEEFSSLCVQQN